MRFLFTAPRFHTNQVPIVSGLLRAGHEVRYFVAFQGVIEDYSFIHPLILRPSRTTKNQIKDISKIEKASDVESIMGGRFIPEMNFLKTALLDYQPDVVICRGKTNLTTCIYALCQEKQIPCILYDQEPLNIIENITGAKQIAPVRQRNVWNRIWNKVFMSLDTDSRRVRRYHKQYGFPEFRITPVKYKVSSKPEQIKKRVGNAWYVPLVFSSEGEKRKKQNKKDKIRILCVAKYRPYKSLPILLAAMDRIRDQSNWEVTVIGQARLLDELDYYAQMKRRVQELKLESRIHFLKDVPYVEMTGIYKSHDILVLPSISETYGMAITEAMAYGLDVIPSDGCGAAFCVDEAGGNVFKAGDAESLSHILQEKLNNTYLIRKQGELNALYVRENCSFLQYMNTLQEVFIAAQAKAFSKGKL